LDERGVPATGASVTQGGLFTATEPGSYTVVVSHPQVSGYSPATLTVTVTGAATAPGGLLRSEEGVEVELFNNANPSAVQPGGKPATFTLERTATITYIQTYHWKSGKPAGTISIRSADGTVNGPYAATGVPGQGGVADAYWEVRPNVELPAGTYTVEDSDPGSWSTNAEMGMVGQTVVKGRYVE